MKIGRKFDGGRGGDGWSSSLTSTLSLGRVVKEEISDDNARLPCFNGRVVSWVRGSDTEGRVPSALPSSPKPQSVTVASPGQALAALALYLLSVWRAGERPSAFSFWSL